MMKTRADRIKEAAQLFASKYNDNAGDWALRTMAFEAGAKWADTEGFPKELPAEICRTRCHWTNPCPGRPHRFLGRFIDRPWRCPQCSRWWVVQRRTSYAAEEGFWVWVRAEDRHRD